MTRTRTCTYPSRDLHPCHCLSCSGATTAGIPLPELMTHLARWLAPLTALIGMLDLKDIPDYEVLMKVIKASMCVQVKNVADTAPAKGMWMGGRKNFKTSSCGRTQSCL